MKKISVIIALMIAICAFASCNGNSGSDMENVLETETTTATTAETTTETTVETTETVADSPWKLNYYVDDFKRPTDDPYISGIFFGTFSNSATTNSNLTVSLSVERYVYNDKIHDSLSIYLYEYDSHLVKNSYSKSIYYKIQVLEENDNVIQLKDSMLSGYSDIFVSEDKDQNQIINALKNNNTLIFRIDEEDRLDTYLFEVDCTGFKELFETTDWNV